MKKLGDYKTKREFRCISEPQIELFHILKYFFEDAKIEYSIGGRKNKEGYRVRWADIGIPSLKIDFEYDGYYWHKVPSGFSQTLAEEERDEDLKKQGWKTIRINKEKLSLIKLNVRKDMTSEEFLELVDKIGEMENGNL